MKHIPLFTLLVLVTQLCMAQQVSVFDAARNNQLQVLQQYVHQKYNIDTLNSNGHSLLILAVYNNNIEAAKYLVAQKANLSVQDAAGNTALMAACFKGYAEISKMLLVNGAPPNQLNYNQANALFFAATFGHEEIVKQLLQYKIDKAQKDRLGKTAGEYAFIQGNESIAALLK